MDELHARQFPEISDSRIPNLIQLQLSAGRGHYHSVHHFSTSSVKSIDTGKTGCIAVDVESTELKITVRFVETGTVIFVSVYCICESMIHD